MNSIIVEQLSKKFENRVILNSLNLTISKGEKILLFGSNGSGKTTLLKLLAGTLPFDSGEIKINRQSILKLKNKVKDHIVYISSRQIGLYPQLSVLENIEMFRKALGLNQKSIDTKLKLWFEVEVFQKALDTKFINCSKGMKQIALIFVQTMHSPSIILLDEPFAGLDENNLKSVYHLFEKHFRESTIIMATHNKNSLFAKNYKHLLIKDGHIVDQIIN